MQGEGVIGLMQISSMHIGIATLLIIGVGTAAVFVGILFAEGARRSGYSPVYHTGSELGLGERGWIMRANFLLMAMGMIAFAVGVGSRLNTTAGGVLLAIFGFGLILPAIFVPDPVHGYPPGAPSEPPAALTWQHRVHHAFRADHVPVPLWGMRGFGRSSPGGVAAVQRADGNRRPRSNDLDCPRV